VCPSLRRCAAKERENLLEPLRPHMFRVVIHLLSMMGASDPALALFIHPVSL
jgi:hypothetical protein